MILIVTGSRSITDKAFIYKCLDDYKIDEIYVGDAVGVDEITSQYAKERNIKLKLFPANWERLGFKAGIIRNKEMVKAGITAGAYGIAIWDGESKGTYHTITLLEGVDRLLRIYKAK